MEMRPLYLLRRRRFILLNVRDVHDIRIAQQQEENRFRAILRETCEYIIETDVETKSYTLHLPTLINRYPSKPAPTTAR